MPSHLCFRRAVWSEALPGKVDPFCLEAKVAAYWLAMDAGSKPSI